MQPEELNLIVEDNFNAEVLRLGALIEHDGLILLLEKRPTSYWKGYFELPGGRQNPGEMPYDTLIREVKEETNIYLTYIDQFLGTSRYTGKGGLRSQEFIFSARPSFPMEVLLSEHKAFFWVPKKEIYKYKLKPREALILKRYLKYF